jgi:hypothetical protein
MDRERAALVLSKLIGPKAANGDGTESGQMAQVLFELKQNSPELDHDVLASLSRLRATVPSGGKYEHYQPDYKVSKNRSMMDFVGCIETPFLMMNENFPGTLEEKHMTCLDDAIVGTTTLIESAYMPGRRTRHGYIRGTSSTTKTQKYDPTIRDIFGVQTEILKESKNVSTNRDLVTWAWMGGHVDLRSLPSGGDFVGNENTIVELTRDVPLDASMRAFFSEKVDKFAHLVDHIKKLPDRTVGRRMAAVIRENLLAWEKMKPDETGLKPSEISALEANVIKSSRKFPVPSIEGLSESKFVSTRKNLACVPGLSEATSMKLAGRQETRQSVAECTSHCSVLKFIDESPETVPLVRGIVRKRIDKACK